MVRRNIVTARLYLFLLGLTAMSTQVILIREAMAIFHGNELIIGLFLGIWMLLTAAGSFLAARGFKVRGTDLSLTPFTPRPPVPPLPRESGPGGEVWKFFLLLCLLPLASLFLLVTLRYTFVSSGIMPGLWQSALVIFLSLAPFCLVSGMLFPIQVQGLSAFTGKNSLSEGYALESAGSIFGGLLFSLIFILALPPYESLILLSGSSLFIICILSIIKKKISEAIMALVFSALVFIMPVVPGFAKFIDQKQFNKQDVIEIKSSPAGMIAVSRMDGQIFIYENGLPVSLGDDVTRREESVHYAMLLHPMPEKVLMISGAANGSIGEVLKYPRTRIDYVDRNSWLLRVIDKYKPLTDDHRVNYFYEDARIFLKKTEKPYDVILINTSEPESAEMNRYYTIEFYKLLKNRLNPGGIISVCTQPAGNYMNETSRQVHSVIFNTLQSVFTHVRIIPGGKDYFLASEMTIDQSIFSNYQNKGIENNYVNPYYINETLLKMRSDLIMKEILPGAEINSDLKPYVFSLFLKQWLERYKVSTWLIPLVLLLLLILSLIFLGPLNLGLFAGGFTASSIEFILLLWFQVMFGFVYQMTGVIFAMFMAGLVAGSLAMGKIFRNYSFRGFLFIQGIFAIFSATVALLIYLFSSSPPPGLHASLPAGSFLYIVLLLILVTGFLAGLQFALSARLRKEENRISAGESFSADLLGSAIGVVLVSVYLVPLLGLPFTGLLLAVINLLTLPVMLIKRR